MELELVMADPAGNRTALVLTPVPAPLRGRLARALMQNKTLGAEQVGYCCPPRGNALGRLEMMGGEFCGNAARSFGLLLAAQKGPGRAVIPVEVSGCAGILAVEAEPGQGTAACPVPVPLAVEELEVPGLGKLPAVRMEGITHVILPGRAASGALFGEVRRCADHRWNWEALGVMFLDRLPGGMCRLTPVVAVKGTGSTVFESSCASGSAAVAAWLCRGAGDGEREYRLSQPGGEILVRARRENGALRGLTVSGPVALEPPVRVIVDH